MKKLNENKKGFTLIEILLVLVVMMSISLLKIKDIKEEMIKSQSQFLSNNIKTVSSAVNAFIVMKYADISSLTTTGGMNCNTSNQTCSLSINELKGYNLLPPNFSSNTILGNPYEIQLKRIGASPNYMISGLILTNGVPFNDTSANSVLLGSALRDIGADGGINKDTGKMTGAYGQWNTDSATFPLLAGKKDYIGSVVGNLSGAYYVYLRRDGTLPMTGDLNLDGHNIANVNSLSATGNITTDGEITAGHWVNAKNGYGDKISLGGDAISNDYELKLSSAKQLSIYSPNAADYTTVMNVNKNMTVTQRLGLMGRNPNDIPSGWTGGLRTADVYADGTIGAGTGGAVNAYMNSVGEIYANGNINSDSNVKGKYLGVNSTSTAGATCAENGLISKTSNGSVLNCISGVWVNIASSVPVGSIMAWGTGTIPSGWVELRGQAFTASAYPQLYSLYPTGILPDFRGYFLRGADRGRGIDSGRGLLTVQQDSLQDHSHIAGVETSYGDNIHSTNTRNVPGGGEFRQYSNRTGTVNTTHLGARISTETRPKNIAVIYIIKAL